MSEDSLHSVCIWQKCTRYGKVSTISFQLNYKRGENDNNGKKKLEFEQKNIISETKHPIRVRQPVFIVATGPKI